MQQRALSNSQSLSRDPSNTHAYLVGGGIASLSAAFILIRDCQVPPSNIHILEESKVFGGAMDGSGDAAKGYVVRGGRMLNFSYFCLYDLLKSVPTLDNPNKNVYQEIMEFTEAHKTHSNARLVDKEGNKVDVSVMGFNAADRLDLLKIWAISETLLGSKRITDVFSDHFFTTNFWYMWSTMFAFQPWHSAVEFKRYLHRFIQEFPRISTLAGVDRTVYNQFDSIILPIVKTLQAQGVNFVNEIKVVDIGFADEAGKLRATKIRLLRADKSEEIKVNSDDLVFVTNGSMVSASSLGSMNSPPDLVTSKLLDNDPAWKLWTTLAAKLGPEFAGNPANFINRTSESQWESFTVTLSDSRLLDLLVEFSGNEPGTGALTTFKDSSWLMSIVVPHQPHFRNQLETVSVFWGYALHIDESGDFVKKPMSSCTGSEILQELLYHLGLSSQFESLLPSVNVIPSLLPYITSQFLTRRIEDRPRVVPKGSTNFAWLGQWTEIPEDTVFTVEYSVRGAMLAAYELMGVEKTPPPIHKGERDLGVIFDALRMSFR